MSHEIQQLKMENMIKEKENASSVISSIYEVMLKDAEDRIQNQSELKMDLGNLLQEGLKKYYLKTIKPWILKVFSRMKQSSSLSSSSLSLSSQSNSSLNYSSEKEFKGNLKEVVTRSIRIGDEEQDHPELSPENSVQDEHERESSPIELLLHNEEVLE